MRMRGVSVYVCVCVCVCMCVCVCVWVGGCVWVWACECGRIGGGRVGRTRVRRLTFSSDGRHGRTWQAGDGREEASRRRCDARWAMLRAGARVSRGVAERGRQERGRTDQVSEKRRSGTGSREEPSSRARHDGDVWVELRCLG